MKKNNKAAAFAVMAAVICFAPGFAQAEGASIDFDGRNGSGFISAASLKRESPGFQEPKAAMEPVQDAQKSGTRLKIKTIVRRAGKTTEETLACTAGVGADKIANCTKSDSTVLNYKDVDTLALRQYFSPETLKFADLLNQARHSYTNQSGPMTFECHDACGNYDLVSIGFSLTPPYLESFEVKCVEWTHECDCVAGC